MTEVQERAEHAEEEISNELEAKRAYAVYVAEIRRLQTRLEDVTRRAAINVAAVRRTLESRMREWTPFLRAHAIEHAAINKKTGEKKKSYVDDEVGAGVFFATRKGTVKALDPASLRPVLVGLGINGAVTIKESYELDYNKIKTGLDAHFQKQAEADYSAAADRPPRFSEEEKQKWISERKQYLITKWCYEHGVELTNDDPYGYFYIGCDRGWTTTKAKQQLTHAIDGKLEITDEDLQDDED